MCAVVRVGVRRVSQDVPAEKAAPMSADVLAGDAFMQAVDKTMQEKRVAPEYSQKVRRGRAPLHTRGGDGRVAAASGRVSRRVAHYVYHILIAR